jgi:hypothetical protein
MLYKYNMKDFLEVLKSPQEAVQYILNNLIKKIINLMEYLGLNVLKGFANFVSNIFSIVPENSLDIELNHSLNKEQFNSDKKEEKNNIDFVKLDKIISTKNNEFISFSENDYSDNLIENKIAEEGTIYPTNYLFENKSRNLPLTNKSKRKPFVCNNKDLYQWKNTSYINRPWFEECERGYCINYQIDDFDDVEASEDNSFRATI